MARTTDVSVKELATRIAKAKGIEADKAAKMLRSRIRANDSILFTKSAWPALVAQGKANKDGNRYPPMPPATADALFTAMTKGKALKDALAKPRKSRKVTPDTAPPAPTPAADAA